MERTSSVVGEHLYRLDLGVLQRFAEEKESRPYLSQVIVLALVRKMGRQRSRLTIIGGLTSLRGFIPVSG